MTLPVSGPSPAGASVAPPRLGTSRAAESTTILCNALVDGIGELGDAVEERGADGVGVLVASAGEGLAGDVGDGAVSTGRGDATHADSRQPTNTATIAGRRAAFRAR